MNTTKTYTLSRRYARSLHTQVASTRELSLDDVIDIFNRFVRCPTPKRSNTTCMTVDSMVAV